jgi:hypothetical protein
VKIEKTITKIIKALIRLLSLFDTLNLLFLAVKVVFLHRNKWNTLQFDAIFLINIIFNRGFSRYICTMKKFVVFLVACVGCISLSKGQGGELILGGGEYDNTVF